MMRTLSCFSGEITGKCVGFWLSKIALVKIWQGLTKWANFAQRSYNTPVFRVMDLSQKTGVFLLNANELGRINRDNPTTFSCNGLEGLISTVQ